MSDRKPILCLDFDGVCHAYTSGWQGDTVIPDDAVPGLFEFLEQVAPHFDIQVYSTRSATPEGRDAMTVWFYEQRKKWRAQGGQGSEIVQITFLATKPSAFIGIDDRVLTFTGVWPDVEQLKNFKPWNKGGGEVMTQIEITKEAVQYLAEQAIVLGPDEAEEILQTAISMCRISSRPDGAGEEDRLRKAAREWIAYYDRHGAREFNRRFGTREVHGDEFIKFLREFLAGEPAGASDVGN